MNGQKCYAWVVVISTSAVINSALLSGTKLRKTGIKAVALVSKEISNKEISKLGSVFDMVVYGDNIQDENLLQTALKLIGFSKMIILDAETVICENLGNLFEIYQNMDNAKFGVCFTHDSCPNWKMIYLEPAFIKQDMTQIKITNLPKQDMQISWKQIDNLDEWNENHTGILQVHPNLARQILETFETGVTYPLIKSNEEDWIAIVGMSCRFPQANSITEYWNILKNGINICSPPPTDRMKLLKMDSKIKGNFLKCPIDKFDHSFFGLSPAEAGFTDPQIRLLLECSWEAFEDAIINPLDLKGSKTGVFSGGWQVNYRDILNTRYSRPNEDIVRKYLGASFASAAAKLSFHYGFTGPNISVDTACSSSLVAVDLAAKSLQRKECPVALACGTNLILYTGQQAKIWAEDGKCKSFDISADGYSRGEGIAALVLKRYSDAIRDQDKIHGIIRGIACAQDGLTKSYGTPTVEAECGVMQKALQNAGVDPSQIDYLEAHATGTAVGDPIEAEAIIQAYSSKVEREGPLWIGSGKTNTGHAESCSGLAGIIKVLLSMKHELIPKHLNFTKLNPAIDFTPISGSIPLENKNWPRCHNRPRLAGVSSFGITGTDVHLILQESPQQMDQNIQNEYTGKTPHLLTISAKSETALGKLAELFSLHIQSGKDSLPDICFTANAYRPHHLPYRQAILAQNEIVMIEKLTNLSSKTNLAVGNLKSTNVCFTFPGKMGAWDLSRVRKLYESYPPYKILVDECDEIFQQIYPNAFPAFSELLTNNTEILLNELENSCGLQGVLSYGLMISCQFALAKLWISWGVKPAVVLGHCLGDLTAAAISGSMDLSEAFKILSALPEMFDAQRAKPGQYLVLNTDISFANNLISLFLKMNPNCWIDVVAANSKYQTVVGGTKEAIQQFEVFSNDNGIKCKAIDTDVCAHSRILQATCDNSLPVFESVKYHNFETPFVSSSTGNLVANYELNGMFWHRLIWNPVQFSKACATIEDNKLADTFIEMGFSGALTKLTKENVSSDKRCVASLPKNGIWNSVADLYVHGFNIDWSAIYCQENTFYKKVDLPGYPFQRKSHWFEQRHIEWHREAQVPAKNNIHPLLGCLISTPLENIAIFENESRSLFMEENAFIQGHLIESTVVFPAAGYMEMFLAAIKNSRKADGNYIFLKNIEIKSSMTVVDSNLGKIQCVLNTDNGVISVYSAKDNSKWKLHATGNFAAPSDISVSNDLHELTIERFENKIQTQEDEVIGANQFYKSLAMKHFNYRNHFKSIKSIYTEDNGDTIAVVDFETSSDFFCHPILTDAMLQTFMFHKQYHTKQKLYVPVKVSEFTVHNKPRNSESGKWYVHCKSTDDTIVTLIDSDGNVTATMKNPEFMPTSAESVIKFASTYKSKQEQETIQNPIKFYNELWQPSTLYQISNRVNYSPEFVPRTLVKSILPPSQDSTFISTIDRLCYLYIVKAIYDVGWIFGQNVFMDEKESELQTKFEIAPGLVRTFKYYIKIVFEAEQSQPKIQNVTNEIRSILESTHFKNYSAKEIIQTCGSNLGKILKGEVKPLDLLFDERKLAERYYKVNRFRDMLDSIETALIVCTKEFAGHELKILEIGAGTGYFTRAVLPTLKNKGVKFEYQFTDISPTLLNSAKEKFGGEEYSSFNLQLLDIEKDPLQQGFAPEYFHIVIAGEVLHATRNLSQTLANVAMLTKTGGVVLIGESERPVLEYDIVFGTLPGYWLFDDDRVSIGHCVVNSDTWMKLLAANGFEGERKAVICCNGDKSIISARKTKLNLNHVACKQKIWLFVQQPGMDTKTYQDYIEKTTGRRVSSLIIDCNVNLHELQQVFENWISANESKLEGIVYWLHGDLDLELCSQDILQPLMAIIKCLSNTKMTSLPKLHLITKGCWSTSLNDQIGVQATTCAMAWGLMRATRLEIFGLNSKSIDLDARKSPEENLCILISELWIDQKETEVVFRDGKRMVRRLTKTTPENWTVPNKLKENLFDDKSTYLITGGKGTIGWAVGKWMRRQGAKYIILVGRNKASEQLNEEILHMDETKHVKIICVELDISKYEQCQKLILEDMKNWNLPPLRGIHHCAGILLNKTIAQHDWNSFGAVLKPKVDGAWNLHRLTQNLALDHFVLYSSAIATFGNIGQSNYMTANIYLDALAQYRQSIGLTAISINWGKWAAGLAEDIEVEWAPSFSLKEGIQALEMIMRNPSQSNVVAGIFDFEKLAQRKAAFLESVTQPAKKLEIKQQETLSLSEMFRKLETPEEKRNLCKKFVVDLVCETLACQVEEVPENVEFSDIGMDSLMSTEFKNKLLAGLEDSQISDGMHQLDLDESGTVRKLTEVIVKLLSLAE